MRYRIQVTVGIGRLAAIIEAACKDNPEPDLRVEQIEHESLAQRLERKVPRKGVIPKAKKRVLPGDVAGIERPITGGKRAELLEAALKTGPKRWSEMRTALSAGGLSESSLNNMIGHWKKEGKIQRSADGLWSLVEPNAKAHA